VSTTGESGYPHGSVGEEAALLASAVEEWMRSAKDAFGPLLTAALGAATARATGFASTTAAPSAAARAATGTGAPGASGPASPRPGGSAATGGADTAGGTNTGGEARAAAGLFGHDHAATGPDSLGPDGECRFCPVCRLLASLRGPRSEVMDYLVEAGTSLLAAVRAAIEANERSWVGGPSVPVEHIDIL